MSGGPAALVGSPRARALRGTSSGGTLVVLRAADGGGSVASDRPVDLGDALADEHALELRRSSATGADALELLAAVCLESDLACLVVVAADLALSSVALLDVLDARDKTCAAVLDGAVVVDRHDAPSAVRVSEAGRLVVSVASAHHTATHPTGYAVGVLRVQASDRAGLGVALAAAAVTARAAGGWHDTDATDLVLLVAVRSGLSVAAVPLEHQDVARGGFAVSGAPGSPWRQRLRAASRGNDGVFSTLAIRPLSRRLTAYGLGRDWSPNVVTAVSLALGLAACAAVATGWWWAWLLGAVLLQASLVVDCVDGEIARFTRRSNPLGGWLDAVSDRVKEFSMVAALAWVSVRRGSDLWWLAVLVLAVLAVRHVEDHAYTTRRRARLLGRPGWPEHAQRDSLVDLGDGGPPGAPTDVPPPAGAAARRSRAVRQVLHLPIAERYLVMSLGLLTMSPAVVLWALGVASLLALAWTQSGRLLRAVTGRDGFDPRHPDAALADLCDLAVLPRPSGRGRLAWQLPGLLLLIETGALLLAAGPDVGARAAAYAWLAAVCWHVYDNLYRLRETGRGCATWLRRTTGVEVRVVALALIGGWSTAPVIGLLVGAVLLAVLYAVESVIGWRSYVGRRAPLPTATGQDGRS